MLTFLFYPGHYIILSFRLQVFLKQLRRQRTDREEYPRLEEILRHLYWVPVFAKRAEDAGAGATAGDKEPPQPNKAEEQQQPVGVDRHQWKHRYEMPREDGIGSMDQVENEKCVFALDWSSRETELLGQGRESYQGPPRFQSAEDVQARKQQMRMDLIRSSRETSSGGQSVGGGASKNNDPPSSSSEDEEETRNNMVDPSLPVLDDAEKNEEEQEQEQEKGETTGNEKKKTAGSKKVEKPNGTSGGGEVLARPAVVLSDAQTPRLIILTLSSIFLA